MYDYQHCIEIDAKANPQHECESLARNSFWLMSESDRSKMCAAIANDAAAGGAGKDTCGYIVVSAH